MYNSNMDFGFITYLVLMRSIGDITTAVTSPAVIDDTKWQVMPSCMSPELIRVYFVWS